MERELKKYEQVEKVYHKIKAASGLQGANKIVEKFLNREATYNKLLISISQYERKNDFL